MNKEIKNLIEVSTADKDTRYVSVSQTRNSFWGVAHESRYNWVLENWDLSGKIVLDFGCGSGYGSFILSKKAKMVYGIDISKKAIDYAKKSYRTDKCKFFVLNACSKREVAELFKPATCDIIVSFDVIEHIERYFDYLENVCFLLRDGGSLIIGCPNRLQLFNWNRNWNPFHFQEFSPYQFRKILEIYFHEVVLFSQDFSDSSLRELIRRQHRTNFLHSFFKKILPYSFKYAIKKIIRGAGTTNRLAISDIQFKKEPGEDVLNNSFGLLAVCRKKKIKNNIL